MWTENGSSDGDCIVTEIVWRWSCTVHLWTSHGMLTTWRFMGLWSAAMEALKKWDGGRTLRGRGLRTGLDLSPVMEVWGVTPRKFLKMCTNLCNLCQTISIRALKENLVQHIKLCVDWLLCCIQSINQPASLSMPFGSAPYEYVQLNSHVFKPRTNYSRLMADVVTFKIGR